MRLYPHPLFQLLQQILTPLATVATFFLVCFFNHIQINDKDLALAIVITLLVVMLLNNIDVELSHNDISKHIGLLILLRWFIVVVILLSTGYVFDFLRLFDQYVLLQWATIAPLVLIIMHLGLRKLFYQFFVQHNTFDKAVIVGVNKSSIALASHFINQKNNHEIDCLGFFDDRNKARLPDDQKLLGDIKATCQFIRDNKVKIVFIALPMTLQDRVDALLEGLRDTTVSIYYIPDVRMIDMIQSRSFDIEGVPMIALCETPFTGRKAIIKRLSDIVLSILILILVSPVLLACAIAVKLSSPGPILFRQRRYGLDGEEINVYKFRSMTVCENGADVVQATRNDVRITPVGNFLRTKSLDELPQFFNVLQGRMSIVGPRPHAVAHNELYRTQVKGYMIRHKVKPGITGWAQVNGSRGETDTVDKMEKRIRYDLDYLRNWSLAMDLLIILKTVGVVIKDENAY
ncbi:MAG: undecaprenyl-phosphate glucose phosphotransferase [Methylococcales bacterium]